MMAQSTHAILVVDDNEDLVENLGEILEDFDVEVHLATNAEQALACFDEREWSLVVTDVRMPDVDGIELLSLIKERSPGTPVLIMTGYADEQTVARAHESGALAVVHKPLDLDAFVGLVEHVAAAEKPVLVVEDDVALIGALTDTLCGEQGVIPHPATSVALARRLAAVVDFHAALIDVRLPDGDALALARELRRRPDGSARPVIIMTGCPELLAAPTLGERAASDDDVPMIVMAKPFQVPALLEHFREIV